jgi:hypothetical protein
MQVWEDAFKKFDADNSGSIDKAELKKAMKILGRPITEAEAVSMMEEADADNSGEIDFLEFRKLVAKKSKSKLWYDAATKAASKELEVTVHPGKGDAMSIRVLPPAPWCPSAQVQWYRSGEHYQAQKTFIGGESHEASLGRTYKLQQEDQGMLIGCTLACGCKQQDINPCQAPLHVDGKYTCRKGWLGLGFYENDGTIAEDPFAVKHKRGQGGPKLVRFADGGMLVSSDYY